MLRMLVVATALVVASGVWAPSGHASCVSLVYWDGNPYLGYGERSVDTGARVRGLAREPACGDTIVNGRFVEGKDHYMPINTIRGVDPAIAFVGDRNLYVSNSSFPALPSHPLHKTLWHGPEPWLSGKSCVVKGTAVIDLYGFSVTQGKRTARIIVVPKTDVKLQRYGTGYVPNGAHVRVVGRACKERDGVLWVKARSVS